GATAPKGKRMGHAGAIVGSADESAAAKKEALKSYGIHVVDSPALIGEEIQKILG
ncbi:succinate--CoA ligase subunit alpha, partial [Campylobacter coli]|nr:succinate--CoA ligase subunit alpha [Campylobacter jejuni]